MCITGAEEPHSGPFVNTREIEHWRGVRAACPWRLARRSMVGTHLARDPVHRLHQRRDVVGRRARHDAVAEVEDVARRRPRRAHDRRRLARSRCGDPSAAPAGRDSPAARPCRRPPRARRAMSIVQSRPTPCAPHCAISGEPRAAALGEDDGRDRLPVRARREPGDDRRASARARTCGMRRPTAGRPTCRRSSPHRRRCAICSLRYAMTARALSDVSAASRSGRWYAILRTVAKSSLPRPSIM